jgi:hypothetical protein
VYRKGLLDLSENETLLHHFQGIGKQMHSFAHRVFPLCPLSRIRISSRRTDESMMLGLPGATGPFTPAF